MGRAKQYMMEQQELLEQEKKEEWIREELNDDEADESTSGWYEAEEKYEDMVNGLIYPDRYDDEILDNKEKIEHIKKLNGFSIVEYEPRDWRLEAIANKVKSEVYSHFIMYDHKGNIETDNADALRVLLKKYPSGDVEIAGDVLIISDVLIDIANNNFFKHIGYKNKRNIQYTVVNPNINIQIKSSIKPVLGVNTIAETLSSIIINQPDDSGMMIGIFGKWGRGKTFLAQRTWEHLKENEPKYQRIIFSAWKYQDTKASWAYLYETFLNKYLSDDEQANKNGRWQSIVSFLGYNKKLWKLNVNKYKESVQNFVSASDS